MEEMKKMYCFECDVKSLIDETENNEIMESQKS